MMGAILGSVIVFGLILEGTQFLPPIPAFPNAEAALRAIAVGLVMLAFLRWRPQGVLPEQHYLDIPRVRDDPLRRLVRVVASKGAAE
jgi:branched-chain amino acid transport system permease protein